MKHSLNVSLELRTNGLVFLDIDGVLNSLAWYKNRPPRNFYKSRELHELDPQAVSLMSRLCDDGGFHVVISSTWRILNTFHEIENFFKQTCKEWKDGTVIGSTPRDIGIRGTEIDEWRISNKAESVPYVIFDDDSDMKPSQLDNFVHVDHDIGLQSSDIQKAYSILEG